MKAMIMAAGMGKRLGRITESIPKALVDINGKSALHIAVETCARFGFDDIIVNIHHFAVLIEKEADNLTRLGYRISISDERKMLLETGGGLFKAKDFFDTSPFLLYNADILTDLDIGALYRFHLQKNGLATLAVRNRIGNRYFLVNDDGILSGWCNNATGERIITRNAEKELTEIAFSGLHIINPEIFNYMNEGIYTMTSLYLNLAHLHKIYTFRCDDGYWFDIGTPGNLDEARKTLNAGIEY